MNVKLSKYETAVNLLNEAPRHVDKAVCAAFEEFQRENAWLQHKITLLEEKIERLEHPNKEE